MSSPNPYHPFDDLDGNGVILITQVKQVTSPETDIIISNFTKVYTGEGLPAEGEAKVVNFDFTNVMVLGEEQADYVIDTLNRLYRGDIDHLSIRNLPGMTYSTFLPDYTEYDAIQWSRLSLNKIAYRVRELQDISQTRH